jgi:hypothetical protein
VLMLSRRQLHYGAMSLEIITGKEFLSLISQQEARRRVRRVEHGCNPLSWKGEERIKYWGVHWIWTGTGRRLCPKVEFLAYIDNASYRDRTCNLGLKSPNVSMC